MGPRRVLWVVVVTTSEWGTGDGCTPAATSPAKWAMSVISRAPTSSAISRKAAKSQNREYAVAPVRMSFGRCCRASSLTSSMSMRWVSRSTWYGTKS